MRKVSSLILLVVLSASGICLAQVGQPLVSSKAAGTAHVSPYNLYGDQYPRIEADGRVTFRFNAPAAQKV